MGLPADSVKRGADVAAVLLSLPVTLPLGAVIALAVAVDSRGPVLFRHRRYGRGGRRFGLVKFRTMRHGSHEAMLDGTRPGVQHAWEWAEPLKQADDPRVTRVGRFLRRSSLDELPQLWNVLRGEMSLVGPRPIPLSERRIYGKGFGVYCRVRPGLTGLWQVSGRSDLPYAERVRLDTAYVRGRSLRNDGQLLLRTVPAVLRRRGAY